MFLHADNEDSDQTGQMPRLIRVFAGRTLTLLVLSCHGSFFQLFVYASGAQYILSHGTASSPMGRALTSGAGLTLAVYTGYKASG